MGRPLDADVWEPDELGIVGPVGFLTAASMQSTSLVYASLPEHALRAPSIPAEFCGLLVEIAGRNEIVDAYPEVGNHVPALARKSLVTPDIQWMLLALSEPNDQSKLRTFMIVRPRYEDPRQAQLFFWWTASGVSYDHATTVSLWHQVQHRLAVRGFTGVVTQYSSDRLLQHYTSEWKLFRTPIQLVKDHHLLELIR